MVFIRTALHKVWYAHTIHGAGIFSYILVDLNDFHVGKYTSPMDCLGPGISLYLTVSYIPSGFVGFCTSTV